MKLEDIPPDLIRLGPAGRMLGISAAAVYKWITRGSIQGWRIAGRWTVRAADVLARVELWQGPNAEALASRARRRREQREAGTVLARRGY